MPCCPLADPFPPSRLNLQRVSAILPMGCAKDFSPEAMLKPLSSLICVARLGDGSLGARVVKDSCGDEPGEKVH